MFPEGTNGRDYTYSEALALPEVNEERGPQRHDDAERHGSAVVEDEANLQGVRQAAHIDITDLVGRADGLEQPRRTGGAQRADLKRGFADIFDILPKDMRAERASNSSLPDGLQPHQHRRKTQ